MQKLYRNLKKDFKMITQIKEGFMKLCLPYLTGAGIVILIFNLI